MCGPTTIQRLHSCRITAYLIILNVYHTINKLRSVVAGWMLPIIRRYNIMVNMMRLTSRLCKLTLGRLHTNTTTDLSCCIFLSVGTVVGQSHFQHVLYAIYRHFESIHREQNNIGYRIHARRLGGASIWNLRWAFHWFMVNGTHGKLIDIEATIMTMVCRWVIKE